MERFLHIGITMPEFVLDLSAVKKTRDEPYAFSPMQLKWLEMLESGQYRQGRGYLADKDNRYCCLGLACELYEGIIKRRAAGSIGAYVYSTAHSTEESLQSLLYPVRRAMGLRGDLGQFAKAVNFPGLNYGDEMIMGQDNPAQGAHTSLASMNDNRMIPNIGGGWRAFNFKEIAAYIRHDPWNVFEANVNDTPLELVEAVA